MRKFLAPLSLFAVLVLVGSSSAQTINFTVGGVTYPTYSNTGAVGQITMNFTLTPASGYTYAANSIFLKGKNTGYVISGTVPGITSKGVTTCGAPPYNVPADDYEIVIRHVYVSNDIWKSATLCRL